MSRQSVNAPPIIGAGYMSLYALCICLIGNNEWNPSVISCFYLSSYKSGFDDYVMFGYWRLRDLCAAFCCSLRFSHASSFCFCLGDSSYSR